jgi:hypothetical protein
VIHLGPVLVSLVLSLVSPATREIDRAFLGGDPSGFQRLTLPGSFLNVSISGPAAFSDLLSGEQTVLWFRKLFRSHRTVGFYPDTPLLERGAVIYKARWEVETPDRRSLAYDVYFLLRMRPPPTGSRSRASGTWSLIQIRAERR